MKKNILTQLIALSIATVVFMGCSKDKTIVHNPGTTASMNPNSGKMAPDPNGGTVTGTFSPTPATVDVSVCQGEWLIVGISTVDKESFVVNQIPPGVYDVRIIYTTLGNSTQRIKLIKNITVNAGQTINLGVISLE